jgi:hypothetical protein
MQTNPVPLSFEVELAPGERLILPPAVIERIGAGHWLVTISPVGTRELPEVVRDHSAFLSSYAAEDEGLYDDCAAR